MQILRVARLMGGGIMTYPEGLTPEERKRQSEERENELARLVKRWQKSHEADDLLRIYDMAKRVMARQARRYAGISGVELDDLMQEAFLALYPALEHYQDNLGSFSGYYTIWIRQSLIRYIQSTGRTVRISSYMQGQIRRYQELSRVWEAMGEDHTDEDYMQELDLSRDSLERLRALIDVLQIQSMDYQADEGRELSETIPAPQDTEQDALDHVFQEELAGALWREVDACGPDQAAVIRMIYQGGRSRQECADRMGCDVARINSCYVGAMAKLRKRPVKDRLRRLAEDAQIYSDGLQKKGSRAYFAATRTSATERAALRLMDRRRRWDEQEILQRLRSSIGE